MKLTCAGALVSLAGTWMTASEKKLPYVYTRWEHFTKKDGLPNDHVFCARAHGSRVWIGTEDGLARLDKETG